MGQVGMGYSFKKYSLEVQDMTPDDAGLFTCEAFNKLGTIQHHIKVKVQERFRSRPIIMPSFPKVLPLISPPPSV